MMAFPHDAEHCLVTLAMLHDAGHCLALTLPHYAAHTTDQDWIFLRCAGPRGETCIPVVLQPDFNIIF